MIDLRPATSADLDAILRVWWTTEPQPGESNPWFAHVLVTGDMAVACDGDRIVGFAGHRRLADTSVLSDCFVEPAYQGRGIGFQLLELVLPTGEPLMTLAGANPRGQALYRKFGMAPVAGCPYVRASAKYSPLEVRPVESYPAPLADVAHLVNDFDGHCVSVGQSSAAIVTRSSIETSTIGPDDDAIAVMASLLAYVGGTVELQLSDQHFAYGAFAWDEFDRDTLMATPDADLPDLSRTTFAGDLLLIG